MKTLLTFATLSLIVLGSLGASAQTRRSGSAVKNKKALVKIQIGSSSRYGNQSYLASRVQQLERIVNMMQERILDLEYQVGNGSGAQSSQYFCEIIGQQSGRSYTAQANSQMQASSQAYSKCVDNDGSFWCERNKVNCDSVGQGRY